jgi:hypothetical protein
MLSKTLAKVENPFSFFSSLLAEGGYFCAFQI